MITITAVPILSTARGCKKEDGKVKKTHLKTISILFIILLSSMSIFTPAVKGVENPYGEKRWRWKKTYMKIIHDNGTAYVLKRPGEEYKYIQSEIISEEDGWAEIKITWEEVDPDSYYDRYKRYWADHDVPDVENLTFMVDMSNNIAYFKNTDEVFGFNPFYIYNYTDYSVLKGEHERYLDLYRRIYVYDCDRGDRKDYLGFRSLDDEIKFVNAIPIFTKNTTQNKCFISVLAKGQYVSDFNIFIPAEYLIDNVTTEEYIWMTGRVPNEDTETLDFLDTINTSAGANTDQTDENGETPTSSSGLPSSVLIAILAVLVTFSSIAGYLGYRKRRKR